MIKTNLIIIGAGPGGYETAHYAAQHGLSVALIEKSHFGGTCLNAGCIPTKCLAHAAELLQAARGAASFGVETGPVGLNLPAVIDHKNAVVEQLRAGIDTLMKAPGISCFEGEAQLVDENHVSVGDETLEADNIILATGSSTKFLPIEGAHLPGVVTSTEMLNLTAVPKRLCVIGGGVIGLEFASIFNAFGSEVTVIEFCKEVLPNLDRDVAKRLRLSLKKQGVNILTDSGVKAVRSVGDGAYAVDYESRSELKSVEADLVLMAVGRTPNMEIAEKSALPIVTTRRGIMVNSYMQTSVPSVYAIGDVNGLCQLAHAASFQGRRAVNHILGLTDRIDLNLIPSAVFTSPQMASVGLREEDAADEKPLVLKAFYRANGRALTMGADEGFMKIVTQNGGKILGVHILGEQASELIHEATAVIAAGGTVDQLRSVVHAHPTLSELYVSAIG